MQYYSHQFNNLKLFAANLKTKFIRIYNTLSTLFIIVHNLFFDQGKMIH